MNLYSKFNKEIFVGILSLLVLGASLFLFWKEGAVDFGKERLSETSLLNTEPLRENFRII
ncbi:Uncharacterized protein AMR48_2626 [Leptospira interrogans]|nr:Uncharacterized protein AMR48_2626 [Leptospira interrogans]